MKVCAASVVPITYQDFSGLVAQGRKRIYDPFLYGVIVVYI